MATPRKPGAADQNQDAFAAAPQNQQDNHAQTPDQSAANRGAYAQSSYQNTQRAGAQAGGSQADENDNMLDTAVQAGKKWLDDSGVLKNANQLPQTAKEWGTKALGSVSGLSTTQKVVGGALLLAGAAYLSTRGKSRKSQDDMDYRTGSRSGSYRQGSWAGYAGGKSASGRNVQSGSRSDVSSYGTERRATGNSASYSSGRSASSADNDFGSGRSSGYGNSREAGSSNYGGSSQGSYNSGSSYNSGGSSNDRNSRPSASSPSSSAMSSGRTSYGSTPNSNEQDYDASL